MRAECVLDASVMARWWLPDSQPDSNAAAVALLAALTTGDLAVHVPDLALLEVSNALWKAARFAGWRHGDVTRGVDLLIDLPLHVHGHRELLPRSCAVALAFEVTVYDASYLALSESLGIPMFTADRRLLERVNGRLPLVEPL